MAERVQLKEPGSELVMVVSRVTPEVIDKNEYFLFGNHQIELLVPQSTVRGRLDHLGIRSVDEMLGKSVRFARSLKMSRANKPFWDLDWAVESGSTPAAPAPVGVSSGSAGASAGADSAKPKMRDAYKSITQWVISDIAPLYDDDFDATTLASITATLFIQACNAGKVE